MNLKIVIAQIEAKKKYRMGQMTKPGTEEHGWNQAIIMVVKILRKYL